MKHILLTICLVVFSFPSWGDNNIDKPWDDKSCSEIYKSIGLFVALADKNWKKDSLGSEKKAEFYASVAANYATIYETVCRQK